MGFPEILTLVFIVLKLTGVIHWSWWLVLLPEMISIVSFSIFYTVVGIGTHGKEVGRRG